jgi:glycosyltransferase involved in cell wall biosynthesis
MPINHSEPVTICIPCYNAGKTIERTLDSVRAQNYPHLRILVCDNSSTDRTVEIIRGIRDERLQLIINPIVRSGEENWNYAVSKIETEYFALFHADDLYDPEMISRQMAIITADQQIGAVFTMSALIDENDRMLKSKYHQFSKLPSDLNQTIFNFASLLNAVLRHENFIKTPTLLSRTSLVRKVGLFDPVFRSSADLGLWLRLSIERQITIIDAPLHKYRISSSQGSATIFSNRKTLPDFFLVTEHFIELANRQSLVEKRSVEVYQMKKGAAAVLCAINLLRENEEQNALAMLNNNFKVRRIFTAVHAKKDFFLYSAGIALIFAIKFNLGKQAAEIFSRANQRIKRSAMQIDQ